MQSKAAGPTKAQRKRFEEIAQIGCLPCWVEHFQYREPDVQHIVRGGRRVGHSGTYGCCPWHHRGVPPNDLSQGEAHRALGPSLCRSPSAYHTRYGTEEELLALQDACIDSLAGGSSAYILLKTYRASRGLA